VWSFSDGVNSQLGHGDKADELVLTLVGAEGFKGGLIVMVVAGGALSVALGAKGKVWTWAYNENGQLGHNDVENRLVPTLLTGEVFGGAAAVLVAAGDGHTMASSVTFEGELWVWGFGGYGQLSLDDKADRLALALVGAQEAFGGSSVHTVACSDLHTKHGALGHLAMEIMAHLATPTATKGWCRRISRRSTLATPRSCLLSVGSRTRQQ